jgi:hypothetical protein
MARFLPLIVLLFLAPQAPAAPSIDLTPRFERGNTTISTLTIETGQAEPDDARGRKRSKPSGSGELKLQRSQRQVITLRNTVTEVVEGVATLDSTIESFTIDAESPSLDLLGERESPRFIYDSRHPGKASGLGQGQAAQLAALAGKSFRTIIEPSGKVRSVTGLESLAKIMTAPMDASPELAALAGALRSAASDDSLRQAITPGFSLFPDEPVQPNEQWTTTLDQPLPMIGSAKSTWRSRLARIERRGASKLATIDSEATISVTNNAGSGPLPTGLITFDQGTGTARTMFDAGQGRAISASMELRLPITVKIPLDEPSESVGQMNSVILVTRMRHDSAEPSIPVPAEKPGSFREIK